jgi:hypothetical protein
MYFSRHESQCRICEQLFSSVPAFDAHLNPMPQKGCIGREGLEANPLDAKGRPKFGMILRKNPDGTSREVWRWRPWKQHWSVTSQEGLEDSEDSGDTEEPSEG